MSDAKDQHEPSMEEILASIRRIISEDDEAQAAEGAAAEPAAPAPALGSLSGAAAAAPGAAPRPSAASQAAASRSGLGAEVDDILELTEEVEDETPPPREEESPLALQMDDDEPPPEPPRPAEPEPAADAMDEAIPPPRARTPDEMTADDRLLSQRAAAASLAAMSELVSRSHREPDIESVPLGRVNQTLEELTRELLRPILKSWLDANLPQLVERIVREEIGRLAIDAQRR